MKKIFLSVLALLLIFVIPSFSQQKNTGIPNAKILLLNSYNKGFSWTDRIVDSIEKYYSDQGIPAEFHVEYMDTKRYFSKEYFSRLYDLYRFKYSQARFDCIISTDDDALIFLIKNRDSLFPQAPVVFAGINTQSIPDTVDRKNFTGIMEEDSPEQTIELMRALQPGMKKIYVICDYSTTGRARFAALHSVVKKFSDITFIYSRNTTLDKIVNEVRNLDPNIPVLLLSLFNDSTGRNFSYSEVMSALSPAVRGPVYSISIHYMGLGIIGGVLNSPEKQGTEAASMSLRIIKGESPDKIPVITRIKNNAVIDYSEAVRKGIDISLVPEGTVIRNRPAGFYTFFIANRDYVLAMLSIFLFVTVVILTVSIVIVMRTNSNRKRLLRELTQALVEVKTLSGLLPICSSCKKIRDDSGYWSQIEQYLEEHSRAEFTHSLCPDCAKMLYPDIFDEKETNL